jgi:hypothetical protein
LIGKVLKGIAIQAEVALLMDDFAPTAPIADVQRLYRQDECRIRARGSWVWRERLARGALLCGGQGIAEGRV